MTSTMFEPPVRRSSWTAEAGLRHCEGFRVKGPFGGVGYVEEVRFDDADEKVVGLAVYGDAGRRFVPVNLILWVDVARELIRLEREP